MRDAKKNNFKIIVGIIALIALVLCVTLYFRFLDSSLFAPESVGATGQDNLFEQQTRPAPEVVKSIAIDDPHSNPELDRLIQEQSKKSVDESTKVDLSFDANPLVHKALVYIGNDQWKDAEPLLLKALDEDPDNLTVLSSLVTVYDVGFGNAAKAISYMEKILSLDPESRGALVRYRFLSSSYRKQSHAIKFLADYSTADHFLIPLTIA